MLNKILNWLGIGLMAFAVILFRMVHLGSPWLVTMTMVMFGVGFIATCDPAGSAGRRDMWKGLLSLLGLAIFIRSLWVDGPERMNTLSFRKGAVAVSGIAIMIIAARTARQKRKRAQ